MHHFSSNSLVFMALSIAKPKHRSLTNPYLVHLFSSSSSSSPYQDAPNSPSQSPSEDHHHQQTSQSSYFTQLRATRKPQPQNQPNNSSFPHLTTPVNLNPSISKYAGESGYLQGIRKKLSEYHSTAPPPVNSNAAGPPYSGQQNQQSTTSFQELYKQHANVKLEDRAVSSQSSPTIDFAVIKESIKQLTPKKAPLQTGHRSVDLSGLAKGQLKSTVIGGTQELPSPMLAKEQMSVKHDMGIEFVKMYSMDELGEKLRSLRPEMKEKGSFSFDELAERLKKLRTMEVEVIENSNIGLPIQQLRESLSNIQEDNVKKNAESRIDILGKLGDLDCMAYPPKEHLVEQYFHPDNMSSAEKLKLELSNVREEFKMSESDCGSARVQVAQLTTKIKHLSSVLHKKDKHSRKGLQEMVQRRKKLLKYLRRTDWDSYCFVLSKLGLRDNADMKH